MGVTILPGVEEFPRLPEGGVDWAVLARDEPPPPESDESDFVQFDAPAGTTPMVPPHTRTPSVFISEVGRG